MRLTPSWFHPSDTLSNDDDGDSESLLEVTIHRVPSKGCDEQRRSRASEFVPESDARLVAVLEEMDTPATVDEIADHLIRPARPGVETWADVHERLHRNRLPSLDSTGAVEFDRPRGSVSLPVDSSDGVGFSRAGLGRLWLGILFALVAILVISVAASATAAFGVTVVAAAACVPRASLS